MQFFFYPFQSCCNAIYLITLEVTGAITERFINSVTHVVGLCFSRGILIEVMVGLIIYSTFLPCDIFFISKVISIKQPLMSILCNFCKQLIIMQILFQ